MSEDAEMWQRAMEEEIGNLQTAQAWELVPRPQNAKIITSKGIFLKIRDNEGKFIKFKADWLLRVTNKYLKLTFMKHTHW